MGLFSTLGFSGALEEIGRRLLLGRAAPKNQLVDH